MATATPAPLRLRVLAYALPVAALLACGGSGAPPASTPPLESATAAEPDAGAQAPAESAPATPDVGASAEPAPASAPAPLGLDTPDECTPVGIEFEKRARPKLKECYAVAKKKSPNLEGTVKIKITVDVKGKIKSTKVVDKTLPDSVADCMLKVVKATPFPDVEKCWDASITIPVTFPTPR